MGINWSEKYNPENLNFLKIPTNIALPTVFSDALSYYEQISKMYHCLLDIVEKVNSTVDLAHEASDKATQALEGVDVAKLKANTKICVYKGATPMTNVEGTSLNLGVIAPENYGDYFVVTESSAEVMPTVCVDYRNGYFGVAHIDDESGETLIVSVGVGLDIPNVVKVTEQVFTSAEKQQARTNIGAADATTVANALSDILYLMNNTVQYVSQTKTDAEKSTARTNIGAASQQQADSISGQVDTLIANTVKYTEQVKTDAEKTVARTNIGAASVAYVDGKPHVPAVVSGDTGKVLTAGANGEYDWETPIAISGTADVLMVNITESGGVYSADKTFVQITQAVQNGWPVISNASFSDGSKQIGVLSIDANAYTFNVDLNNKRYVASVNSDNSVTVTVTDIVDALYVVATTDSSARSGTLNAATMQQITDAFLANKLVFVRFGYDKILMTGGVVNGTAIYGYDAFYVYTINDNGNWTMRYTGGHEARLDADPSTANSGTYTPNPDEDFGDAVRNENSITISWSGGSILVTQFAYTSASNWTCKGLDITHKRIITLSNNGTWTAANF